MEERWLQLVVVNAVSDTGGTIKFLLAPNEYGMDEFVAEGEFGHLLWHDRSGTDGFEYRIEDRGYDWLCTGVRTRRQQ